VFRLAHNFLDIRRKMGERENDYMRKDEDITRFMRLFRGNFRSYGQCSKDSKLWSIPEQYSSDNFEEHLNGIVGLGISPIMDDNMCYFGAIDLDAHGDNDPDIDLQKCESVVVENNLPLMVCRSKSGGVHFYLFCLDPIPAMAIRTVLNMWAKLIVKSIIVPVFEVFPKQIKIYVNSAGVKSTPSWINLPYFDIQSKVQRRYCFNKGAPVSFTEFLDVAESKRTQGNSLEELTEGEHAQAPPCIKKMMSEGVGQGHRNVALYNFTVYFKKAFDDWRDRSLNANAKYFNPPLSLSEAKKVVENAGRRDYRYKCQEEPCKSLCDSAKCVTLKYGISNDEKGEYGLNNLSGFERIKKILTAPPKWEVYVAGRKVVVETNVLMDWRLMRNAIAEQLTKVLPSMKNSVWEKVLAPLVDNAETVSAPDEASVGGFIRSKVISFIQRIDLSSDGKDIAERSRVVKGFPIIQEVEGKRHVYFRGQDFIDFLKRTRCEELKGGALWMELRKMGMIHTKLRVGESTIEVWGLPLDDDWMINLHRKDYSSEF